MAQAHKTTEEEYTRPWVTTEDGAFEFIRWITAWVERGEVNRAYVAALIEPVMGLLRNGAPTNERSAVREVESVRDKFAPPKGAQHRIGDDNRVIANDDEAHCPECGSRKGPDGATA